MKNNILVTLITLVLISCNSKEKVKQDDNSQIGLSKYSSKNFDELKSAIDSLIEVKQYLAVKIKLDSLIMAHSNEPYFYLKRGICETQLMMHKEAISDFNKALSMGYKEDFCRSMIKFNELALNDSEIYL